VGELSLLVSLAIDLEGTFRDTTGFALTSGGIFSGSGGNKGDAEIRYRGQVKSSEGPTGHLGFNVS